jgi:hypothetical protein
MKAKAPDWRAGLATLPPGGIAVFQPAELALGPRRVARALLEEAAILGGGQVVGFPGGDLLLGNAAAPGQRAAQAIASLTGTAPPSFPLPQGQAAVTALCEAAALARPPMGWSLAALEAHCAQAPLEEVARLTLFQSGAGGPPVAQRLGPAPLCPDDPELEALARDWLCRRILAALTHPTERARLPALRPGLRLILDLPLGGLAQGAPLRAGAADDPNGPIALLPLASLADPVGFAGRAEGLRQGGWTVGLLATHPAALDAALAPGLLLAAPAGPDAPPPRPAGLIALGRPAPPWCRGAGILHEGFA